MSEKKHEEDEGITMGHGWGRDEGGPFLSFDGNYGRCGAFSVTRAECMGCGETRRCLHVDQSEGEYTAGTICLDCIERLFVEKSNTPHVKGGGNG